MSLELCEADEALKEKYRFRLPHSEWFADYLWPGLIITGKNISEMRKRVFGENDIVIATYPKSGTTWASEVISAIAYEGNIDLLKKMRMDKRVPWLEQDRAMSVMRALVVAKMLVCGEVEKPVQVEDVPQPKKNVYFTHVPVELLPPSVLEGKCKFIYVARNPKDQCVSFYHFHRMARFLGLQTETTWDEFFRLFCTGDLYNGNWFEHVLGYWRFVQMNPKAKFITFEDMKADLIGMMPELEEFVGVPLSEEVRRKVVEHCSFGSMKDNKMANRDNVPLFDNKKGPFMRKGEVGDWVNYFTKEQSEAFDKLYALRMAGSGLDFKFF